MQALWSALQEASGACEFSHSQVSLAGCAGQRFSTTSLSGTAQHGHAVSKERFQKAQALSSGPLVAALFSRQYVKSSLFCSTIAHTRGTHTPMRNAFLPPSKPDEDY